MGINKIFSKALIIAMLCFTTNASADNEYGLADNCQDGTILHCFDWSFNQIKEELPNIAKAGFTSVQTSPSQGNAGNNAEWYFAYQPRDFCFADGGLGTKQELINLCKEAEKYGIKVIVDVVSNHLNGSMSYVATRWHDSQYWHTHGSNINYGNRWQITHGDIGMRDINSEHSTVYSAVRDYVDELKSYGVDGIRWDAAKHIGLPSEGCDFWSAVTKDTGLWHYGEILVGPTNNGDNESLNLMKEYTNYISVTDDEYGKGVREAIQGGYTHSGPSNWIARGIDSKKIVYWAESHDTYSNNGEYGTDSRSASVNQINRTYALLASRDKSTALYFARPNSSNKRDIRLGQKGRTDFKNAEVAAVNHFHNAMLGQKDYYVCENGAMAVCREKGVVVVKPSGSGTVSISNGGKTMTPGTYKDKLTGNTWTVTSSTISGTIGSTGIAVVYDYTDSPYEDTPSGDNTEKEWNAYFNNSNSNWTNVYAYVWDAGNGDNTLLGSWPGTKINYDSQSGYYKVSLTAQITTPMIIFNNGDGAQTSDLNFVNNGIYTSSGYTNNIYQEGNNGNDTSTDEYSWIFYYNDNNWSTSTVYAYVWDAGDSNKTYLGNWPGSKMTKNDEGMWQISFNTTTSLKTPMVIFNNGQSNGTNQTADFTLINNGIYKYNGFHSAGIENALYTPIIKVYTSNSSLVIESTVNTQISITSVNGLSKIIDINEGTNYITDLPRGVYIVNNTKIIL